MKKNVAVNRICAVCLLVMAALLCGGCYTQLATYEPSTGGAGYSTDEDIKRKARQRDTIHIREREHCVWTRNFWGEPVLRCYDSRYSWQWRDYNYEPWWYRNSPYYDRYHDPRCPMYYYYDPACGCCRYYEERPSSGGGSGGGGSGDGAAPTGPPPLKSRSDSERSPRDTDTYGAPKQGSVGSGGERESKDEDSRNEERTPPPLRSRSFGVPSQTPKQQDTDNTHTDTSGSGASENEDKRTPSETQSKRTTDTRQDTSQKDTEESKDTDTSQKRKAPPLLGR
jgi:hypothetical protein